MGKSINFANARNENEQPQSFVIWSPAGSNTATISLELAELLSNSMKVLLAELPCLGRSRICFVNNDLNRDQHIDDTIIGFEKKDEINLGKCIKKSERLHILQANPYGIPDYPTVNKVELDTLIKFPARLMRAAIEEGYGAYVAECQGLLTTPMTFFTLVNSDCIMVPVQSQDELAIALLNIKRLLYIYKVEPEKLYVLALRDKELISELAIVTDEEGKQLRLKIADSLLELIQVLYGDKNIGKSESGKKLFGVFKSKIKQKEEPIVVKALEENIKQEEYTIKL